MKPFLPHWLGGALPPKAEPFVAMCEAYRKRQRRWPVELPPKQEGLRVGVLVAPWVQTAVPLFSLECARALTEHGCRVRVIFDPADLTGDGASADHLRALEAVLEEVPFPVLRITASDLAATAADVALAEHLLHQNAIWKSRGEQQAATPEIARVATFAAHCATVRDALHGLDFDWLLIPGGIYGLSGVYVGIARELGLDFSTYDSGVGLLRLAHGGITTHLADMPAAVAEIRERLATNDAERDCLNRLAGEELSRRTGASDAFGYQLAAASGATTKGCDILVPLNVRWDAAALSRQRLFPTVDAWLETVLEWVAAHPTASICLRQHPIERRADLRTSDSFAPLLKRFEGLGDRLRFVAADETVSTYDLLPFAKVVLPHTSTLGVEAAYLGKPVLLAAHCYYEGFSFAIGPASVSEYLATIGEALAGRIIVSAAQREEAAAVYFLTQCCAWLHTGFTPNPTDFNRWVLEPPETLWAQPPVADFHNAMASRRHLPVIRYEELIDAS